MELEKTVIVIPACYSSSRLPGKPLADIHGKPMIQHVYERASLVPHCSALVVATDDQRVFDVVQSFGGQVVMTSPNHPSGTDRLAEVSTQLDADIYVNIQGDEPLLDPNDIATLLTAFQDPTVDVATLCHTISASEAKTPNAVKVVLDQHENALYFSRSLLPFPRTEGVAGYLKHIGVYAYRKHVLQQYPTLPPCALEQAEMLEQLRLLYAGFKMKVKQVSNAPVGVDTPACLEKVRAIIAGQPIQEHDPLADIRLMITDVDGVLTDGGLYYNETGECLKRFHVRDGLGIKMFQEMGGVVAVVSGRDSPTLRKRVADLGITLCSFGVKDKASAYRALMETCHVSSSQTACVGDDSIDLPGFAVCGVSFAVADAPHYVKSAATHVLHTPGGKGALREALDNILEQQGKADIYSKAESYSTIMTKMAQ